MELAQIILITVVVILTILLVILGVQVFYILKELRKTVEKLNAVLDDAESITRNISEPIGSLSSLFEGLKTGAAFISMVKNLGTFSSKKRKGENGEE